MFNLSGSEVIVILVLALILLGPDKLPDAMRKAGRAWAELRKLSTGFQDEIRRGFDEPVREVRKTADTVRSAATFTQSRSSSTPKTREKLGLQPPTESAEQAASAASDAEADGDPETDPPSDVAP